MFRRSFEIIAEGSQDRRSRVPLVIGVTTTNLPAHRDQLVSRMSSLRISSSSLLRVKRGTPGIVFAPPFRVFWLLFGSAASTDWTLEDYVDGRRIRPSDTPETFGLTSGVDCVDVIDLRDDDSTESVVAIQLRRDGHDSSLEQPGLALLRNVRRAPDKLGRPPSSSVALAAGHEEQKDLHNLRHPITARLAVFVWSCP